MFIYRCVKNNGYINNNKEGLLKNVKTIVGDTTVAAGSGVAFDLLSRYSLQLLASTASYAAVGAAHALPFDLAIWGAVTYYYGCGSSPNNDTVNAEATNRTPLVPQQPKTNGNSFWCCWRSQDEDPVDEQKTDGATYVEVPDSWQTQTFNS